MKRLLWVLLLLLAACGVAGPQETLGQPSFIFFYTDN